MDAGKWTAATMLVAACLGGPALAVEDRASVDAEARAPYEQSFLYMTDTHGLLPKQVLAGYSLAYSSDAGAIRPVPGHFDQEGVVHGIALEAGLLPRLSIYGTALIAQPLGPSDVGNVAVQAGARVTLTNPRAQRFRLVVQTGFLREFGASYGIVGEVTGSVDVGRVRFAAALHGEHIFAGARDPIDLYVVAGVSVRVHRVVRLGAEYVAQDFEAAFDDDEAERGARQYLGPNVALALFRERVLVTAGAAAELARTPGVLARTAVSYVY